MAGLPIAVVFGFIAWFALRRGWTWVAIIAIFCLGNVSGRTSLGSTITGGFETLIDTAWAALVTLLSSVAR